ncbi:hypothetical protein C8034_v006322 [Colletotrichum sidae]|uniref:Uncharacterized protein n=1 Tax=Colletotrichum sidae TaxID=1347389 RepID=A0A4R8TTE7_9PEZI|nr:hypothetical protein C8034_v006322 [Colletotrichum sidae]
MRYATKVTANAYTDCQRNHLVAYSRLFLRFGPELPRRHSRASHRVSSRSFRQPHGFRSLAIPLGLRRNSGMADLLVPLGNSKPPAMTSQPITTD